MSNDAFLEQACERLADEEPQAILAWAIDTFTGPITLASSLSKEDQVLTHFIAVNQHPISIFMLDTGRLFEETHQLLEDTQDRYAIQVETFFPDTQDVEDAVNQHGHNYFRQSAAFRKHCCLIRKVKPLGRALQGKEAWITGLRRDQSASRGAVQPVEWDESNHLYKINPLWRWTDHQIQTMIEDHQIPYNPLHDQGYPSIGCAPCTRAVAEGEDPRSGRWWWETPDQKECGIHMVDGKVYQVGAEPTPV